MDRGGQRLVPLQGGESISQLVFLMEVPAEMREYVVCYVNGKEVPAEQWSDFYTTTEDHVLIAVVPRGGGGKGILRSIALIALAIAAPYTVPASFGAVAAGAWQAGVVIAGALLINAVFPPPSVNTGSGGVTESPALTLQGQRNQARPYQPVPKVYGRHRFYPPLAAEPYVKYTGQRDRWLYVLLDLGYGRVDIEEAYIGETPIEHYGDAIAMKRHQGTGPNIPLRYYTQDISQNTVAFELKKDAPHVVRSEANVDEVHIDFTFPSGLVGFSDGKGKKIWAYCTFSIEFKKASEPEGAYRRFGLAESYGFSRREMYVTNSINDGTGLLPRTPYNSKPLSTNTDPTGTIIRLRGAEFGGDPDSDPVQTSGERPPLVGFPAGVTTLLGTPDNDITAPAYMQIMGEAYVIQNNLTAGIESTITLDRALESNLITEPYVWDRATNTYSVITAFEAGGTALANPALNIQFKDGRLQPFTGSLNITFAETDQYDIRVTRLTDDQGEDPQKGVSQSVWSAMRSVRHRSPVNFDTEHTLVELRIKATDELNGTIDTINFMCQSQLVVYNGTNHNWEQTRNPAWVARDILTSQANPYPVPASDIDDDSFLAFANWCDRISDSEDPTTNTSEPMYRFDGIVDYNTTAWELAQSVVASARGTLTQVDGKYAIAFDEKPTVPVQLITPHNSWGFSGNRVFAQIPDAFEMTYVDPDRGWQKASRWVYNDGFGNGEDGLPDNPPQVVETINLLGVTRATQAWRDGRYHLFQAILRQETYTLQMDIENLVCTRGDYVRVQHDVPRTGGLPARIAAINGRDITLTEPLDVVGVGDFWMTIRQVGTDKHDIVDYNILDDGQVDPYTVTLTTDPVGAAVGDLAVWGVRDTTTDDYLVAAISPGPDLTATLTLVPLAPAVYDADKGPVPIWNPVISPILEIIPPPVENIQAQQSTITYINRYPVGSLRLFWDESPAGLARVYEVYWLEGDNWTLLGRPEAASYTVFEAEPLDGTGELNILIDQELEFKVLAVGATGKKVGLDWVDSVKIIVTGDDSPPGQIENFTVDGSGDQLFFSWTQLDDPDIERYQIRWHPYSYIQNPAVTWETSNLYHFFLPWSATNATGPWRFGSYSIAALDTSGNWGPATFVFIGPSTSPVIFPVQPPQIIDDGRRGWPGAKVGCSVDGNGNLVQDNPAVPGTYTFEDKVELGTEQHARIISYTLARGLLPDDSPSAEFFAVPQVQVTDGGTVMADWITLASVDPIGGGAGTITRPWRYVTVSDLEGAEFQFRYLLWSLDGITRCQLDNYTDALFFWPFVAYWKERTVAGTDTATQANPQEIFFGTIFAQAPNVTVNLDKQDAVSTLEVVSVSTDRFIINATLDPGNSGALTWQATGFGEYTT